MYHSQFVTIGGYKDLFILPLFNRLSVVVGPLKKLTSFHRTILPIIMILPTEVSDTTSDLHTAPHPLYRISSAGTRTVAHKGWNMNIQLMRNYVSLELLVTFSFKREVTIICIKTKGTK